MNDMINERDKEFANEFSRFVNGKMCSASKVGAEFANDHRFLVNEKFKVMMAFMEQLAVNYQKGYYDLRNEWACTKMWNLQVSDYFQMSIIHHGCSRDFSKQPNSHHNIEPDISDSCIHSTQQIGTVCHCRK